MVTLIWDTMALNRQMMNMKVWLSLLLVALSGVDLVAGVTQDLRPRIFLEYSTRRTAIDPARTRMWLDQNNVTSNMVILPGEVSYRPEFPLEKGEHTVTVLLVDQQGERKEKTWTFTVEPDSKPLVWKTSWEKPTPANGAVLKDSNIKIAFDVQQPLLEDLEVSFWHSENGAGFKQLPQRPKRDLNRLILEIDDFEDGAHSIEVRMVHRGSGVEKRELTAFVLDRNPPRLEGLSVNPQPWKNGQDLKFSVRVQDAPWHVAKEVRLWLETNDGRVAEAKTMFTQEWVDLTVPASTLKDWPEGTWRIQGSVKDYAGHEGTLSEPVFLQVIDGEGQSLGDDLKLNPYAKVTSKLQMSFSGETLSRHELALWVNEERVAIRDTDVGSLHDGKFYFQNISLEPGLNSIFFELYDTKGKLVGERRVADPILVDVAPPRVLSFTPAHGSKSHEPRPKIRFQLEDIAVQGEDLLGVGIHPERVLLTLAGETLKLEKNGTFYESEFSKDLSPGEYVLDLFAEDLFRWSSTYRSSFTVTTGMANSLQVDVDRDLLYAVAGEVAQLVVKIVDEHQRPISDGTIVTFKADQGTLSATVPTVAGRAETTYLPGLAVGPRRIEVGVLGTKIKETIRLKVEPAPEIMPYSIQLQQSSDSMVADGGQSRIEVSGALFDERGKGVPDGLEFSLSSDLCEVIPAFAKTSGGKIRFALLSKTEVGMATIKIRHRHFQHRFKVPLQKPKPGPAQQMKLELWPPVAKAGSSLPLRLVTTVNDRFGQPVPDGSLVTFRVDRGRVQSSVRTVGGVVENFLVAPDTAGEMVLRVRCGKIEETLVIPVELQEQTSLTQKIEILSPSIWIEGANGALEGRLLDGSGVQVSKDTILWVQVDGQKFRSVARGGLFSWSPKTPLAMGEHTFLLECEGASQPWKLTMKEKSVATVAAVVEAELQSGILDLDFQLDRKSGDVRRGILIVREVDRKGQLIKREVAPIVTLSSTHGELPPKSYLVNGVSQIPFNYLITDRAFVVEASMAGGKTVRLDFLPEHLPELTFESTAPSSVAQGTEAVPEVIIQDQNSVAKTEEPKEETSPSTWLVDQGLEIVRLSGRLELEAGGRDRTRMRYRLLDRYGEDLPDGTEVELRFDQGRLRPTRTKVKRGVIQFQLETTDWVGSYPLEIRVGQVRKEERVRIRAPQGGSQFLPGLPTAAGDRRKLRRGR